METQKFDSLKEKIKNLEEIKTRNQISLENLQSQEKEILQELNSLGYKDIESAEQALVALETELNDLEKTIEDTYKKIEEHKVTPPSEESIMNKIHERVLESKKVLSNPVSSEALDSFDSKPVQETKPEPVQETKPEPVQETKPEPVSESNDLDDMFASSPEEGNNNVANSNSSNIVSTDDIANLI